MPTAVPRAAGTGISEQAELMESVAGEWIVNPIAFEVFGLPIRWYALAYLAGFILGWRYALRLARKGLAKPTADDMDEFLTWAVLGTILGGRVGYVLFYQPQYFLENPLQIVRIWEGGMSFHGGMLGVIAAMLLFARRREIRFFAVADVVATVAPIGLFFGRIANFVNQELYGRITDLPWGVVFPIAGREPRHPSQLYEAFLEGAVLFTILSVLARRPDIRGRPGSLSGLFLIGYGIARFSVEFLRQPDSQLGFLWLGATMGQLLSAPMVLLGVVLFIYARRGRPETMTA